MPLIYLRRLTGRERTESANRHLARYLAFVAGAANAGGFLAVRQYTSHMSGIVSLAADAVAVGQWHIALNSLAAVLSFLAGAFLTTILVRWARARELESEYALPLVVEALLLVFFGLKGKTFAGGRVMDTIALLCLTMGLQNAMITKISGSVIRTTHLTGMVTDIGIALGRVAAMRWTRSGSGSREDFAAMRLLSSLIGLFFVGGIIGALGFKHLGFLFTLPLAVILLLLAIMPVVDDIRRYRTVAN